MDSVVISLLIICYGVYEYRRREKAHRAIMEHLTRGEVLPAPETKPRSWRLLTTGSVCALLAGFSGVLFYTGLHSHSGSARPLTVMACMIAVPLVILVMIFVRDLRQYLASQHDGKEPGR